MQQEEGEKIKVAELVLETEGKKETYVIAFDPKVEDTTYDRFEWAKNPQDYLPHILAILAIKGQKCLIPKAEWEKQQADQKKGLYPWLKGGRV